MKLLLTAAVCAAILVSAAKAQSPAPPPPSTFTLTVTADEVNTIGAALGKLPYETAAPLIASLKPADTAAKCGSAQQRNASEDIRGQAMSFMATAAKYDKAGMLARVRGLKWAAWRPSGVVLHNTGGPNLRQAQASPETAREAVFSTYYRSMHWHSGPHVNVWWDDFYELCSLEADGVHCSCFNLHPGQGMLGFECLGDYDRGADDWSSGLGAQVRDNAVFLCAAVFNRLGLPVTAVTLRPHHDCVADHHACPGNLVDMDDFRARVISEQASQRGIATPVVTLPPAPPIAADHPVVVSPPHDAQWLQASLNTLGAVPPLSVDGYPGRQTAAAVEALQRSQRLSVDGIAGPITIAAINDALAKRATP